MWGIQDLVDSRILTARREPRLLFAKSRIGSDGLPLITLRDGAERSGLGPAVDRALSEWLGKPVALVPAAEREPARAEYFADATDDSSRAIEWTMPCGRFVDAFPVLLLSTPALAAAEASYPGGAWDVRRFRPNILVRHGGQGWVEDKRVNRVIHIGSARLVPRQRCIRCTMVNRAQPGLERDVNIYKALLRSHGGEGGMWTQVQGPGLVSEGDALAFP